MIRALIMAILAFGASAAEAVPLEHILATGELRVGPWQRGESAWVTVAGFVEPMSLPPWSEDTKVRLYAIQVDGGESFFMGDGYLEVGPKVAGDQCWLLHVPDESFGETRRLAQPPWASTTVVDLVTIRTAIPGGAE